ncbi:hypothetical protein MRX96_012163 [Rhipicephalus microplus]
MLCVCPSSCLERSQHRSAWSACPAPLVTRNATPASSIATLPFSSQPESFGHFTSSCRKEERGRRATVARGAIPVSELVSRVLGEIGKTFGEPSVDH